MGIFPSIRASTDANTLEEMIRSVYGGSTSSSGVTVNSSTALSVGAVYTCVQVLSQSYAQTPCHLFENKADGTSVQVSGHKLGNLICDSPNDWMTDYDMKALIMTELCLRGNSLWLPTRAGRNGRILELIPIHPDRIMGAEQDEKYRIFVKVQRPGSGDIDSIPYNKVLHFKALSTNGFWGVDPISLAREIIGLSVSAEKYGSNFFSKGAKMGGIMTNPKPMTEKASKNLMDSFNANVGDIENSHKTVLLEEGAKWMATTMTSDNAQFLETRKFQRSELAGWYRVPSHFINDLEKATFSNVEHLDLSFVKHTLAPYFVSTEKTFRKALMTPAEKSKYFFKFNADSLVRGDLKSRYEAYSKAVMGPWLTADEVRNRDDLGTIEGGDKLLTPMNMGAANEPTQPTED